MPEQSRVSKMSINRGNAPVALVPTGPGQIKEDVQRAMQLADWKKYISRGANIALKPNLGWDKLIPGSISAPWVVEAVIEVIQGYVGKISIVESNQIVVDVEKVFRFTGLDEVCKRHNVEWVNMSKGKFTRVQDPSRFVLKDVYLPEILLRTELITLPVLKTHNKTVITGAIKNQWGCLETLRHNFHLMLSDALVDVNHLVQPRFAVLDGTVGLEGDGPKSGRPKEMDVILASANLVGLDATAARLMGFDPELIPHLISCAANGFGSITDGLNVVGGQVQDHLKPFIPAKHNMVSWLELSLRKSIVQWLVFQTPLLNLFAWGARRYYDLWDTLIGRGIRKRFLHRSKYKNQWL